MNSWLSFLEQQGAQRNDKGVTHFIGHPVNADADASLPALCALTHLNCLWVEGPDARKFLQGQVTCNMDEISSSAAANSGHFTLGAHCNTKGRMAFSFYLVNVNKAPPPAESFALIMEQDLVEPARQILTKYAVFSKSQLLINQSHVLLGLCGPQAAAVLGKVMSPVPTTGSSVTQHGGDVILTFGADRLLCLVSLTTAERWWQQLQPNCWPAGYRQWQLACIRSGEGSVGTATVDEFIPQQLNFDVLGGVSFNKGCYIGQEVVARMQYRGKLKRHMRRASVNADIVPIAGASLFSTDNEQSVGNVVNAVALESGTIELLAVVTDNAFTNNNTYLDKERSQKLQFLPLPYAITN